MNSNVDRLFAIWQVLNPDSYVTPEPSRDGSFTRQASEIEDINTALTPFWIDSSNFHTSVNARTTTAYGYAYPETQSWNFPTPDDYTRSVTTTLNRLYGMALSVAAVAKAPPVQSVVAVAAPAPAHDAQLAAPLKSRDLNAGDNEKRRLPMSTNPSSGNVKQVEKVEKVASAAPIESKAVVSGESAENVSHLAETSNKPSNEDAGTAPKEYNEWITNIRVQKHCLGGAFQVHVFVGDVPVEIDEWITHANNVGTFTVLGSNPATTSCGKCKSDADQNLIVTGVVPLTEALLESIGKGQIRDLEPEHVVPYLTKELHWRVTQVRIDFSSSFSLLCGRAS